MGVHGLTSYIAKHSSLHTTLLLPPPPADATAPEGSATAPAAVVKRAWIVDALAFLYHVGLQDTLRGGNYKELRENVRRYVEYWRACGLEPEFVWDGPFDSSKLPTVVQRSQQSLKKSLAYMRASDEKRGSQPQLAASAARLPLLSQNACIAELRALGVPMWFAEGEADSPTAELAQRRGEGALVGSNDSDYFIFPSSAGYVPLQRIEYGPDRLCRLEHVDPSLPPCLRMQVHHHTTIAKSLCIPPSHLPAFAALIGNDQFSYPELLLPRRTAAAFPGQVDKTDTLRIARALAQVDASIGVEDAVRAVVPTLLSKPSRDPNMIANLLRSAGSYQLQPLDLPSPSFPLHPRPSDTLPQAQCRLIYLDAFRLGRLNQFSLSIIKHRQVTPGGAVEVPEYQSPSVSIGRPLRLWIYAILDEAIGFSGDTSIIEHVRRQEELYAAIVLIPKLQDLLDSQEGGVFPSPIVLGSPEERLSLYIVALAWPGLPPPRYDFFPLVLALRHIQRYSKRPWSSEEILAALTTAVLLASGSSLDLSAFPLPPAPPKPYIQRSVELVQALFYQRILAEVLLVTELLPEPHELFNGALFHLLLGVGDRWSTIESGLPTEVKSRVGQLWEMVVRE
ncbi:PIN domain-like protein [Leucosporidium creatinivorum]|uniref:PIN domain-like protein n=1 Tax=Leucosporidium creatinivorum TaxID=106004 RepID=A0A1Y2FYK7_9BASI|nr:PIN domain-like protein [Leucosporidium creatinivorum]